MPTSESYTHVAQLPHGRFWHAARLGQTEMSVVLACKEPWKFNAGKVRYAMSESAPAVTCKRCLKKLGRSHANT